MIIERTEQTLSSRILRLCISESTLMYFYVHMLIYYNLSPIRYTYKLSAEVTVLCTSFHLRYLK